MSVTVLYDQSPAVDADAREEDGHLWLSPDDFRAATGWTLKPEGLCHGEACVPLPRDGSWLDSEGRVDLGAFAARFGRPSVHDAEHSLWAFGEQASARREQMLSLQAPDFTLPDLDGNMHSLSDFRGKKVFLMSWGSY
jgi:hypothetical protein